MANTQQYPAGQFPQITKPSTVPYFAAVIGGTIPLSGSVSGFYDLSDWTLAAIEIPGTLASGTINFWAASTPQGSYRPVYDTAGNQLSVIGTAGNQIITDIPELAPLRYIELVTAGTQTAAQTINLIVK